jgi:AcrR family transcriptional regulator
MRAAPSPDAGAPGGTRRGRSGSRREEPTSARRDTILALAAEIFAGKGFAATTVREIADAAGILSGSLYHHFDSKESIVDEILGGFLDEVTERYHKTVAEGDDPVEVLRALVRDAFFAIGQHRAAVAVMQNEIGFLVQFPRFAYLREVAEETERLWVGVLRDGIRTGAFRSDIDPRLTYRFLRDAVWVAVRWYRPGGSYTPEDIAEAYLTFLLDGITTRRSAATTRRGTGGRSNADRR